MEVRLDSAAAAGVVAAERGGVAELMPGRMNGETVAREEKLLAEHSDTVSASPPLKAGLITHGAYLSRSTRSATSFT